jgi:hypothetical protein
MGLNLNNPGWFGQSLLDLYLKDGWASLGKRDIELLVFLLLERDGAILRTESNYDVARKIRSTEAKVIALRRDAYAKWRPLIGEQANQVLERVLKSALEKERLEQTAKFATDRRMKEGFLPLLIEHPDDRAEVEHAIKQKHDIPIYERNREVILIHYLTLLKIAEELGLLETDPLKIQKHLKKFLNDKETLSDFLKTPVDELTLQGARAALNDAGKIVVEGALRNSIPMFLKAAIPGS